MHRRRPQAWVLAASLWVLVFAGTARASSSLFPLDLGRSWWMTDGTAVQVVEVASSGEESWATTTETASPGESLLLRWHQDAFGDARLLGYTDSGGASYSFDPPLLWMPAVLRKGDEWDNRAEVLNSEGKPVRLIEQRRMAAGVEHLDLDWGSVDAMRIETFGDRTVATLKRSDIDPFIVPWVVYYAPGLGTVRQGRDALGWIDVRSFGIDFVPVVATTVGGWKAAYLPGDPPPR